MFEEMISQNATVGFLFAEPATKPRGQAT